MLVRKGKVKPWQQAREETHGAAGRATGARTEVGVAARGQKGQ